MGNKKKKRKVFRLKDVFLTIEEFEMLKIKLDKKNVK